MFVCIDLRMRHFRDRDMRIELIRLSLSPSFLSIRTKKQIGFLFRRELTFYDS